MNTSKYTGSRLQRVRFLRAHGLKFHSAKEISVIDNNVKMVITSATSNLLYSVRASDKSN